MQQPGDAVALAVTVNEGHAVCVTTQNGTYTVYFDGHMSTTGSTAPNSSGYGTLGSDADHTYVLGLFRNVQTAQAAFCDGSTTLMHPLNDGTIRFFGLEYGPGNAFPQIQAITKGTKPYSLESGNCPPPSTPSPAVRHKSIGTPLRATGPGDCSAVTPPGDLALLSVAVTGGHTICVVQHATEQGDTATTTFLDGHQGTSDLMRSATPGGTTNNLLVIGTDQRRIILLAAIPDYAERHAPRLLRRTHPRPESTEHHDPTIRRRNRRQRRRILAVDVHARKRPDLRRQQLHLPTTNDTQSTTFNSAQALVGHPYQGVIRAHCDAGQTGEPPPIPSAPSLPLGVG